MVYPDLPLTDFEKHLSVIATASLPDIRTIEIADTPIGVAGATMVSLKESTNTYLSIIL
jgi:hypothetical protein